MCSVPGCLRSLILLAPVTRGRHVGDSLPTRFWQGYTHITVPPIWMRKHFSTRCHHSAHSEGEIRGNKVWRQRGAVESAFSWHTQAVLAFCCGRPAKSYRAVRSSTTTFIPTPYDRHPGLRHIICECILINLIKMILPRKWRCIRFRSLTHIIRVPVALHKIFSGGFQTLRPTTTWTEWTSGQSGNITTVFLKSLSYHFRLV